MSLPESFDPAERGERARACFQEGYNCCQAVLLAFADILEASGQADDKLLKTIGAGFGGGFGRMREVCGAFSGCTMMAGFIRPASSPEAEERKANYAFVQELAEGFKERNGGSIICGELLGLRERRPEGPEPSARTPEYYKKRPCPEIVRNAATLVAEKMKEAAG